MHGDEADRDARCLASYLDTETARTEREAAFAELMGRHARRVYAVCLRVLGDHADAEEATQETFVRLARSAHGFRGEAALSTWLYRVAHNTCTDLVRREARRPRTPVADIAEVADLAQSDGAEQRAELTDLGAALERLEDAARTALLLVAVDDFSYAEVAELTGVAVGTVKSRVCRARVQLAHLLTEDATTRTAEPGETIDAPSRPHDPERPARGPP